MIIVHDENLKVQHVIYEHPIGYERIFEAQGKRWVRTQKSITVSKINLQKDAQGTRTVSHKETGETHPVLARSAIG